MHFLTVVSVSQGNSVGGVCAKPSPRWVALQDFSFRLQEVHSVSVAREATTDVRD